MTDSSIFSHEKAIVEEGAQIGAETRIWAFTHVLPGAMESPPCRQDQHHLHHAFLKAGFSVAQTGAAITLMVLFTTTIGLAGLLLEWPEYLMFYGYLGLCGVYLLIMRRCWRHHRFLGRDVASELS